MKNPLFSHMPLEVILNLFLVKRTVNKVKHNSNINQTKLQVAILGRDAVTCEDPIWTGIVGKH